MNNNRLHTPEGVRDFLVKDSKEKNIIEQRVLSVFHRYGFEYIQSPTLEYYEVFSDERGNVDPKKMYKLIDRNGSILVLRPDMTPAIARIAATSYLEEKDPLRFCYLSNTFRHNESFQGKMREFTQAGVELLGDAQIEADAEIIALAVNSLSVAGLKEFQIDIGQVQFFKGLVEEIGVDEETEEKLRQYIDEKNYIAVEELLEQLDLKDGIKEILLNLPNMFGSIDIIEEAKQMTKNKKALWALDHLMEVYHILCDYGVEKYITFDLGMVNQFNYYTGIIFRGYSYGTGTSIIAGGRYDELIGKFGKEYPAVGFAVMMDELILAMRRQDVPIPIDHIDTMLLYTHEGRKSALKIAEEYRSEGMTIVNGLFNASLEENMQYGKKRKIGGILYFTDSSNVKLINLETNEIIDTTVEELLNRGGKS